MTNPDTTSAISIGHDVDELDALAQSQPHDKHISGPVAIDLIKRIGNIARNIARKATVLENQRDHARGLNTELLQTIESQSLEISKLRGQLVEESAKSPQTGTQEGAGSPIAEAGGSTPVGSAEPHDTTGLTSRVDDFPPTT